MQVLAQMADDFISRRSSAKYSATSTDGSRVAALRAQLKSLASNVRMRKNEVNAGGIIKLAFDTRHFDQEVVRNPRSNLQYWHRQDPFILPDLQARIDRMARTIQPLQEIKAQYHKDAEWHNSYVRKLAEDVERILRVKEADDDIMESQIAYLEQLLDVRYQITTDRLDRVSSDEFKSLILKKDEDLMKNGMRRHQDVKVAGLSKDGDAVAQQSIINAIFGNNQIRRDGEKTVTRTITISITDTVGD